MTSRADTCITLKYAHGKGFVRNTNTRLMGSFFGCMATTEHALARAFEKKFPGYSFVPEPSAPCKQARASLSHLTRTPT